MRALYTAATGMAAQELNVQVISNNIANMRTTGFKRQRAEFQDLMYQNLRRVGSNTSDQGTKLPIGLDIGAGVKTTGTPRIMSQGSLLPTEKELDVAIRGEGFFRVLLARQSHRLFARGLLRDGRPGPPGDARGLSRRSRRSPSRRTRATSRSTSRAKSRRCLPGQTAATVLGQFSSRASSTKSGLEAIGDNLYLETAASGPPQTRQSRHRRHGHICCKTSSSRRTSTPSPKFPI